MFCGGAAGALRANAQAMPKKLVITALSILVIACIAYAVSVARRSAPPVQASAAALPGGFGKIDPGLTESQVLALVGPPRTKGRYPRYEQKPASYWAALQQQADAGGKLAVYGSTPSLAYIKARAELTHRYKDVWQYKPTPSTVMTLYFGDDGTLLNMGLASGGGKGGPGASGAPPPH